MQKEKFFAEIAEMLETDISITEDTDLNELEEYDSMTVLSLIAFIDENFSKKIPGEAFKTVTTVKSLMEKIGTSHFE